MLDYVRASGDLAYLRAHRDAVQKAWRFETIHDADGDGIYDNAQGTGWVESWPNGMPHQEVYLALLDQQASAAMAELATLLGDTATAVTARDRATTLTAKIEAEYYDPAKRQYAFSRNPDGSLDRTATIYPAIAWWNGKPGALAHPDASLRLWTSPRPTPTTTPSATIKAPSGRSSPAGPPWRSTAPATPSPATPTSCRRQT
jgi:hypothetical protein